MRTKSPTKTPKIKAPFALCATGLRMRKKWAAKMNLLAHQMHGAYPPVLDDQWQKLWGHGYASFANHVSKCLTCQQYKLGKTQ